MCKKMSVVRLCIPILFVLALILDNRTAFSGTAQGLEMCIRTVIPSLFPFFVISVLLTSALLEKPIVWLRPLGKLCGIPFGAEGIFLLGLVGGYPVGAQAVTQAWQAGSLSEKEAKRMLGFCNNCGPSFLFGITGILFRAWYIPWILWAIHLLSSLLTGMLLPCKSGNSMEIPVQNVCSGISAAVKKGMYNLATVCGWILLALCATAYVEKWFLDGAPLLVRTVIIGFAELTNGCIALSQIDSEYIRFLFASGFLAFGGCCVALQTVSVTGKLGTGWYFPGKVLHCSISVILSYTVAPWLYSEAHFYPLFLLLPAAVMGIILHIRKKEVAISEKLMYNHIQRNDKKESMPCFSAVKSPNPAPTAPTEPRFPTSRFFASKKVS